MARRHNKQNSNENNVAKLVLTADKNAKILNRIKWGHFRLLMGLFFQKDTKIMNLIFTLNHGTVKYMR